MNEWIIPILLAGIGAALWIASYFAKNPENDVQEEFEELSLDLLQDMHGLKKRVEFMEQEMKIESSVSSRTGRVMDITKRHVLTLYTKGVDINEITEQMKISDSAVQDIIDEYITEGL